MKCHGKSGVPGWGGGIQELDRHTGNGEADWGQDGPANDGDNDKLSNIGEFAFGTLPDNDSSFNWPVLVIVNDGGTNYPAVRYQRNKLATGITITVTAASEVPVINTLTTTVKPPVSLGEDLEEVTVRVNTPASATPKVFFHVATTQPKTAGIAQF